MMSLELHHSLLYIKKYVYAHKKELDIGCIGKSVDTSTPLVNIYINIMLI